MDVTDFGPSRLDDDVEVVGCRDCGKVVLRDALGFHRQNCQLIRAIAEREISPSIIEGESASSLSRKRNLSEASDSSFDHVGLADSKEKLSKKARKALEVEARKKARLEAKEAAKQGKANKRKKGKAESAIAWALRVVAFRKVDWVTLHLQSRTNGRGYPMWRHQ